MTPTLFKKNCWTHFGDLNINKIKHFFEKFCLLSSSAMSMSSVVALLLIVNLAYSQEFCDVQALISANNANGLKKFHLKVKNNINFQARTYLQPHYCNGVFGKVYLSAAQH